MRTITRSIASHSFGKWLEQQALADRIKMPFEIHNEIAVSTGPLRDWICRQEIKKVLILDEEADADMVGRVLGEGYGENLN